MEHLPTSHTGVYDPIHVPYLCDHIYRPDLAYDHGSYKGFPERKGFTLDLRRIRGGADDMAETACLLQSWCFFGLVVNFFRAFDHEVQRNEFLRTQDDGACILTTATLCSHIAAVERKTRSMPLTDRAAIFCNANPLLVLAGQTLRQLRDRDFDVSVWGSVHLSALLLGEYLDSAMKNFLQCSDPTPNAWWGWNRLLPDRMNAAGWCPNLTGSLVDEEVFQSSLYYLSTWKRTDKYRVHNDCTAECCVHDSLDDATYQTRHADSATCRSGCAFQGLEIFDAEVLLRIVEEHETPVVSVDSQDANKAGYLKSKGLKLRSASAIQGVQPAVPDPGTRYVGISHVWADGLGNRENNALPACQLIRLQNLVDALYNERDRPMPFWIDTICVPLAYPHRTWAIENMRNIYAGADKVLVLDFLLTEASLKDMDASEIAMRIRVSSWNKHLWTFHEAYLAEELWYQFSDRAIRLSEVISQQKREHRIASSVEAVEMNNPARADIDNEDNISDRTHLRVSHAEPVFSDAITFLERVEALDSKAGLQDHEKLKAVMHPLRWRTTSRQQDETICLSGCVGRTVNDLTDPSLSAPIRMKTFLNSLKTVPAGLMFVDRPHFEEEGCRWMPTSLLGGGMRSTLPDQYQYGQGSMVGRPTRAGLLVHLPGIILRDVKPCVMSLRDSRASEVIFLMQQERAYWVYGLQTQLLRWSRYGSAPLALILDGALDWRGTFAVLVSIKQIEETKPLCCRFEASVMVIGDHENVRKQKSFTPSMVTESCEWCVS